MAIRPFDGRSGNRGPSMPSGQRGGGQRGGGDQLDIFGGGGLGGGLFGGRDPFAEFGSMDTFGGGRGGGGLGGGFGDFGGMMKGFEDMQKQMGSGARGGGVGMSGGMMPGGNGQYACQSFCMSSQMGPDGKMHTERYSSSDIGNHEKKVRESQQAYSNSSTGKEKMGLERQLGDRARKVVKERDGRSGDERSTEMFRGMDESSAGGFDRDFGSMAHHMPAHPRFDPRMLQNMPASGSANRGPGGRQIEGYSDRSSGRSSTGSRALQGGGRDPRRR